jgi:disulfide bond formation protein DsbB
LRPICSTNGCTDKNELKAVMLPNFTMPVSKSQALLGLLVAALMAATVGIALGFQHIGGYIPCKLCLEQRTPYYAAAPLMLAGFVFWALSAPAYLTRACFALGAVLMAYGMFLGVFHAGVEWAFWAGPADCSVTVAAPTDTNILSAQRRLYAYSAFPLPAGMSLPVWAWLTWQGGRRWRSESLGISPSPALRATSPP